ncbi:MAG: prephenate dehydratase [Pseudomonadota bacterium]
MNTDALSKLRTEIDGIDREILALLTTRAAAALQISSLKNQNGWPVYDPQREKQVLARLAEDNTGPLPESSIKKIFGEIISACRAVQKPTTVSFLGPEDTFTHLAAIQHFGRSVAYFPRGNISDVFREVEHGRSEFGVVPAENSTNGAVSLTLDEWVRSDLKICGEILLPISHCLMARETDIGKVQRVFSHPQALGQCRAWLARNLVSASLVEMPSTAAAAIRAGEENQCAAIGGEMLAERYGLEILARNIQDRPVNLTRFFILGRQTCRPTGRDKTSVLFTTVHQPGSLYHALTPLAQAGLNLTRIESRPTQDRPWEYYFFIDFEGHQDDENIKGALGQLAQVSDICRVLGSYPAAVNV